MSKHLCDCGKIAQYNYMPATDKPGNKYYCYDCIVSDEGCSCNWRFGEEPEGVEEVDWKWVKTNGNDEDTWQYLDINGNPYVCCEYDFEEEGYEIEVKLYISDEQKKSIVNYPEKYGYTYCDIYLKNGNIINKEFLIDKEYFWVAEDLHLTNQDILKIDITNGRFALTNEELIKQVKLELKECFGIDFKLYIKDNSSIGAIYNKDDKLMYIDIFGKFTQTILPNRFLKNDDLPSIIDEKFTNKELNSYTSDINITKELLDRYKISYTFKSKI